MSAERTALLSVEGARKEFPGLVALDDVSLDVHSGEIVAVLGHNGSGKSTLVKMLAGLYVADGGRVTVASGDLQTEMHFIHQDLGLIPELTAVENFELLGGVGTRSLSPHRRARETRRARERIARFGARFDVEVPVGTLSPAQRSIVAIARALDGWTHDRNVLVLDEPTEALHRSEVDVLFAAVRGIAARGAGIVFISHRLDEVLDLADRLVVLRDGRVVADLARAEVSHDQLVKLITGSDLVWESPDPSPSAPVGEPALAASGLRGSSVHDVDLEVHPGEVVGVAGVLGSGREEIASLLFGERPGSVRELRLAGTRRPLTKPARSIQDGMAFVPGDRARLGGVLQFSARENLTLPRLAPLRGRFAQLRIKLERAEAQHRLSEFDVRPARPEQAFGDFSGGNQQKIVISKWLRNEPNVLLMDEPTQGVDVGAKGAIYGAIRGAAERGAAVLVCSSDAKELAQLCRRVVVLRDGRVARVLSGEAVTEASIVRESYGVGHD